MRSTRVVSATEFQRNIGAMVDAVRTGKETVIVLAYGRPQMVVLPVDRYDALMAAAVRGAGEES